MSEKFPKIEDRNEKEIVFEDVAELEAPIKKVSEEKHHDKPNIIFIPGKLEREPGWMKFLKHPRFSQKDELEHHLQKLGARKEKRILIVTDTLKTGGSLLETKLFE